MNICNYNWNVMALEILQDPEIYTTELGIDEDEGTEKFTIENTNGYTIWLERVPKRGAFKFSFGEILGGNPDVFIIHYLLSNSRAKEMEIEFYGKGW
jgi:hypothetical protein